MLKNSSVVLGTAEGQIPVLGAGGKWASSLLNITSADVTDATDAATANKVVKWDSLGRLRVLPHDGITPEASLRGLMFGATEGILVYAHEELNSGALNFGFGVRQTGTDSKLVAFSMTNEGTSVLLNFNGITGARTYTFPNASGILDLAPEAAKVTPVDADSVKMHSDSANSGKPKWVTFANLWVWIKAKIDTNLTIAGTKVWSGVQRATAQNLIPATPEELINKLSYDKCRMLDHGRFKTIDPRHGWTANAAINGSTTALSPSGRALTVQTSTTLGSEAYIATMGFNPRLFTPPGNVSVAATAGIDYSRRFYVGLSYTLGHGNNNVPNAATEGWIRIGHDRGNVTFGAPAESCIGWKFVGGDVFPFVHNGTTLNVGATPIYSTGSVFTPLNFIEIIGNGSGGFAFWVNGVLQRALTGGPTGYSGQSGSGISIMLRNNVGGTATNATLVVADGDIYVGHLG
jgi:hypothetical protein